MTAMVCLTSKSGQLQRVRALLDSGSQINLLAEHVVQKLKLPKYSANVPVIGVGGSRSQIRHKVVVRMTSNYSDFAANVQCLVTPKVTGTIPSTRVNIDSWNIPPGILLADASFNNPTEVEMLIGADLFFNILMQGQIKMSNHLPTLYETQFGWVVAGSYENPSEDASVCSNVATTDGLEACLQRFFDQEEVAEPSIITSEEQCFEEHYQRTYRRDPDGRFVVQLPFRDSVAQLSNSRSLALKGFLLLEKRLAKNPDLKTRYAAFIDEYQALGHCREVNEDEDPVGIQTYYLPHHCVLKPSSSSTQLRVVFDATAKAGGLSLNDVLMIGLNSQSDIFSIVLRFRTHTVVFSVDVSKMYRQILVDPSQTRYQRIFWRRSPSETLKVLELLTVTYGTSSASFLAVRSLIQLARDEMANYPEAAKIILCDTYMDDILSGAETVQEARKLREDLEKLMLKGGFPVRKWCSNSEEVLEGIAEEDRETLVSIQNSSDNQTIKALGLLWDPRNDLFLFHAAVDPVPDDKPATKRLILSQVAKIFDPLGLVAPVIVEAKIIMQKLWASSIGWDEPLDGEILQQWAEFQISLRELSSFEIPRCVMIPDRETIEIHGFADASQAAYGACLFVRCIRANGSAVCHLLCSKSKIAPLRAMTIPRLELNAALLLARLVDKVVPLLKVQQVRLWSDSQIVLAWIKKSLDQMQLYVRNRVAEINRLTECFQWGYVNTSQNPADIVSRGMKSVQLKQCELWWNGPPFLTVADYETEQIEDLPENEIPELKEIAVVNPAVEKSYDAVFDRFSSYLKLQRVLAQVVRFLRLVRTPREQRKTSNTLTVQDMHKAEIFIIRLLQRSELQEEMQCIERGDLPKRFATLQPFIDSDGLLRVGGRLQNSRLPYDAKHQLLLPQKHRVTKMLVKKLHEDRLHEGQSGLLAAVRQKFWITNARSVIRKVIHDCVKCFRANPRIIQPLMGNLPESRVTMSAPFELTGIDYAGPVYVKEGRHKPKVVKAYIALFVCLTTKAIHLELVSDLTTEAFLAALDHFVNRRGMVRKIFSDNATNFVGASKELRQLREMFSDQYEKGKIDDFLINREVGWEFIPPRSPNFGGLWEAGVKIVKSHLTRTLGNATLTFEEFSTVLTHIEAIVNSRPLYAASSDPNDPLPISPAHLMLGRGLDPVAKPPYLDIPSNRLSRWQYLNQLRDHFWSKWSREYLSTLQSRAKWTRKHPNIEIDTVVLLAEDNQPPQAWKLGRVVAVFPGNDGVVRVADVKTTTGVFRRAVECFIPIKRVNVVNLETQSIFPVKRCSYVFSHRMVDDVRDGYVELVPGKVKFDNIQRKLVDFAIQTGPPKVHQYQQTDPTFPTNAWSQYLYEISQEEKEAANKSATATEGDEQAPKPNSYVQELLNTLEFNQVDMYKNDYPCISKKKIRKYQTPVVEECLCFADRSKCGNRYVSAMDWHPKYSGIFVAAYNFDALCTVVDIEDRESKAIDPVNRIVFDKCPVLMWSFDETLTQKLELRSSREVTSLSFCPYDGNLLLGGLASGQIIIWDLNGEIERVEKVEDISPKQQGYRQEIRKLMGWSKVEEVDQTVEPVAISAMDKSPRKPITVIKWLPRNHYCATTGQVRAHADKLHRFILTASIDGSVCFWDLDFTVPALKKAAQTSKTVADGPASPYQALDNVFYPIFRIKCETPITSLSIDEALYEFKPIDADSKRADISTRVEYQAQPIKTEYRMKVVLGSLLGDIIQGHWEGHDFDQGAATNEEGLKEKNKFAAVHDGSILSVERNPFCSDIFLTIGGNVLALWSEECLSSAIFWRKRVTRVTAGKWSLDRACVFFITNCNGDLEIWDTNVRIDAPCLTVNLGGNILTYISQHKLPGPKKFLAVADYNSNIRILTIPITFSEPIPHEVKKFKKFIQHELTRKQSQDAWIQSYYEAHKDTVEAQVKAKREAKELAERMEVEKKEHDEYMKRQAVEEAKKKAIRDAEKRVDLAKRLDVKWRQKSYRRLMRSMMTRRNISPEQLAKQMKPEKERRKYNEEKRCAIADDLARIEEDYKEIKAQLIPVDKVVATRAEQLKGRIDKYKEEMMDYHRVEDEAREVLENFQLPQLASFTDILIKGRERREVISRELGANIEHLESYERKRLQRLMIANEARGDTDSTVSNTSPDALQRARSVTFIDDIPEELRRQMAQEQELESGRKNTPVNDE